MVTIPTHLNLNLILCGTTQVIVKLATGEPTSSNLQSNRIQALNHLLR